jgi:hypothetical protein
VYASYFFYVLRYLQIGASCLRVSFSSRAYFLSKEEDFLKALNMIVQRSF